MESRKASTLDMSRRQYPSAESGETNRGVRANSRGRRRRSTPPRLRVLNNRRITRGRVYQNKRIAIVSAGLPGNCVTTGSAVRNSGGDRTMMSTVSCTRRSINGRRNVFGFLDRPIPPRSKIAGSNPSDVQDYCRSQRLHSRAGLGLADPAEPSSYSFSPLVSCALAHTARCRAQSRS